MAESSGTMSVERRERSSLLAELSTTELVILLVVAVHLVIPSWPFGFPTVGKTATLFALAPLGLVSLAAAARRRDRASLVLVGFLVVAGVSGLLAESPVYALRGDVTSWMTVAVYLAAGAWWSLGRELGAPARQALPWIVLAAMVLNALVGLMQVVLDIRSGPLATIGGRAHGLLDNPVFYGTLGAGVCAWLIVSAGSRPIGVWTAGAAVAAFATGLSASRAATGAVVLACLLAIAVHRSATAITASASSLVGLFAASSFSRQFTSSGTLSRLAENSGSSFRSDMWRAGFRALPDRLLLGHGFNHFSTAVDGELSQSFLREYQFDDLTNPTRVPHNFVVLLLVSVGIVGTLTFAAWLVAALRGRVDVALLAAAGAIGATWMLQPASQHSLPVALILLGAAVRPVPDEATADDAAEPERSPALGRAPALAVVIGALLAGYVLVGMARFDAATDGDAGDLARAAAWFPDDAEVARAVSLRFEGAAVRGESDLETAVGEAIIWAERSATVAPNAQAFARLARLQLAVGRFGDARSSLDRALELQHWNPNARELLVSLAIETGDDELLASATSAACEIDLEVCDE